MNSNQECYIGKGLYLITNCWINGIYEHSSAFIVNCTGYKLYGDIWIKPVNLLSETGFTIEYNPTRMSFRFDRVNDIIKFTVIKIN